MSRLLIIGSSGQLGRALLRAVGSRHEEVISWARKDVDLLDLDALKRELNTLRPDLIINASAYTAVDRAESEPERAFALNRDAPAAMALYGAPLVHISTDYVFSGAKHEPYVETDMRGPINVYGKSKAAGEDAVLESSSRAVVIRTSWVYSPDRANFVKTMLRLAEEQEEVSVVADQIGRPTSADDLAHACLTIGERLRAGDTGYEGIFHYSGAGDATWADFAEFIFASIAARGHRAPRVIRITTDRYQTPAKRPLNSRLDTSKIEALGVRTQPWCSALEICLEDLLQPPSKG